ncbi:hypothetical protein [Anaeromyxobacter paludicola]|uniref:CopG family transcriptional regulator n=1 Tax=Anaeromyxobacter paludicola TaxID=2918171 RepID=A0ABM7XAF4_9BACT|nr:hypothetical protein [Anaeromyxobacter paludicola]BDG08835.1 hypothetical protein AMPC_19480 [Anaeromyxobacter paludicola]
MSQADEKTGICSTVVDELLAAQAAARGGSVCSTVVDELLAAQAEGAGSEDVGEALARAVAESRR